MCVRSNVDGGSWAEHESLTAVLHIWTRIRGINHIENTHPSSDYPPRISLPLQPLTGLSFYLSLSLSLWLSADSPGANSLNLRNVHRSCTRRIHDGPSPWRKGLGREVRGGARVNTYDVRLKSNLMTMSITVCGRVRTYLPTYNEGAIGRVSLSQPFIDWFAVARPNFLFTEGPLDRARSINMRAESTDATRGCGGE